MTKVTDLDALIIEGSKLLKKTLVWRGDAPEIGLKFIPLGIPEIDVIIGGGIPLNRLVMVYGDFSSGKTLLVQWVIKAFQEAGEIAAYIDAERCYDAQWFKATGVKPRGLLVARPVTLEETFDLAALYIRKGVGLIIIDSLTALMPADMGEAEMSEQDFMGLQARKISEGIRKLVAINERSTLVYTNQLRSKIGRVFGSPDSIPGGRAQKFFASLSLKMMKAGWLEDKERGRHGFVIRVVVEKSKVCRPFQECLIPIQFTGMIDAVGGVIQALRDLKLLRGRRGDRYLLEPGIEIGSQDELNAYVSEHLGDLQEMVRRSKEGSGEPGGTEDI